MRVKFGEGMEKGGGGRGIVEELVEDGRNVGGEELNGKRVSDVLSMGRNTEIVNYLIQHGEEEGVNSA